MPAYQIQLTTSDAQTLSFTCDEGEDLITAAEKANIFLAAQCHMGSCGACIAHCDTGEYTLGEYSRDALNDADRAQQQVLLCCTFPHSDMSLRLPYTYNLVRFETLPVREAEIVAKTYLTEDTVKLNLQLLPDEDGNPTLDFEPGQFVELFIPDTDIKRAYSLANAPNWDGSLECLVKLRAFGKFSTFLHETTVPGMKLRLEGPQGTFVLRDNGLRPRYFVAGGCGLASIISMLRRMAEWGEPHPAKLFFGVWSTEEVFFQQELRDLAATYPNLEYQICATQAEDGWEGYRGSAVAAFAEALKAAEVRPDIYICGSPGLIEAVIAVAEAQGFNRDELMYERYLAHEKPEAATRCEINAPPPIPWTAE
ncbi:FAD-binding oxidoreductase [Thiothrix nivea]|uniref:Oxidoreductase FAD-binding domain protein n=1 Tax=Thiothrix nivea (strain ATCC 35100 / DSM 5205 / JP2) TaxID=870187 RepID=A0A656HD00_THINJ|nr:2Fe-2S iron-sulfur cluster binding domain-containing protein [Thiothrix nivea]EIJ34758.1 Oxidoreductase FAD-binding domain protein [Thiothrix nivea DSM 5205]